MIKKPKTWFAVSATVTSEYVEPIESVFNEMDSLGSAVDLLSEPRNELCTVTAYFSLRPELGLINKELKKAAELYQLPSDIDFVLRETVVDEQDWLAEWKKYWKPVELGRFIIAAPWHEVDDEEKITIRIEPNMAFGTGTHETTKLCLEAINRHYEPGQSFLDVGTGTGILVIAAAKMAGKAAKIVAVDVDPEAVAIARVNAEINGEGDRISFAEGTLFDAPGKFDFVCANLTADVIVPILPELIARTRSTLILSGILAEQEALVRGVMPENSNYKIERAGEWIAFNITIS